MTVNEVRAKYLAFFKARGHTVIPSAPIVPENDPTTLFTSSGMQPLVPYLLGEPHPEGSRLVDSQLSFRAGDIEEVGDNRHTTFFEMLGNWSLGDYFKKEQLPWIFDFLTDPHEGLGFDPAKLYVTVFDGDAGTGMALDTEAVEIWQAIFAKKGIEATLVRIGTEEEGYEKGMQGGRIFSYGAKKNWWSRSGVPANMPPGEPGGPDSEIFYDFGTPHDPKWGKECHVNCDCGRFVEICNSVFMQYVKNADGTFSELPKKNVDFGGGLERLTAARLGTSDVFDIDVFDQPRKILGQFGSVYGTDAEVTRAYRIVLDHIRAAIFMIAAHVVPSNTEQGYVLRRLIRRAVREARRIGVGESIFSEIVSAYVSSYCKQYPFLSSELPSIQLEIKRESDQFGRTIADAIRELWKLFDDQQKSEDEKMNADILFTFFTTHGFPPDLTLEEYRRYRRPLLPDSVVDTWLEEYASKMKEHQALSRAGAAQKFAGGLADHSTETVKYHTTHHLLLKALQMVLGPEVHQRGSNITSERLRIDFNWGAKMTPEQIREVERIVNEKIAEGIEVVRTDMPKTEAEKLGAEHEFGATYPETVSVYSVGPVDAAFSIEFCGGPHVSNTREIGEGGKHFKIIKEEASSAGVRRIKAVLE